MGGAAPGGAIVGVTGRGTVVRAAVVQAARALVAGRAVAVGGERARAVAALDPVAGGVRAIGIVHALLAVVLTIALVVAVAATVIARAGIALTPVSHANERSADIKFATVLAELSARCNGNIAICDPDAQGGFAPLRPPT